MIVGYDISSCLEVEAAARTYSDGGSVLPLEQILADHGATHVRLRLWVDPHPPHCDLPQVLEMARRASDAGLGLLLDFHYSDFWADPGKQHTPRRWVDLDLQSLAREVRQYTESVMRAFHDAGTAPAMVQIGNEITTGMLWPLGEIYRADGEHWDDFVSLLRAGIAGARAVDDHVAVMVHIDRGGDNAGSRYFFDQITQRGVEFDLIGLSYYPWYHGPMSALRDNLNDLAERYSQPIIVVETAYPWTLENGDDGTNMVTEDTLLPAAFPASVDGQRKFLRQVSALLADLPAERGQGLMYWEPAWLPGVSLEPDSGNGCDNLTLFDHHGNALPSLDWHTHSNTLTYSAE